MKVVPVELTLDLNQGVNCLVASFLLGRGGGCWAYSKRVLTVISIVDINCCS